MRMRIFYLFLFIFMGNFVDCTQDEFVTIWAPKKVYEKRDYNVFLLPTGVEKRTEISLQFRKSIGTIRLNTDKTQKMRIINRETSGGRPKFNLIMTLHRNETVGGRIKQKCSTKTLHEIEAEKKTFHIFIQLSKPIYKPGDEVKFHVLIVDRMLNPFHMNNLFVNITDPLNRLITSFDDPGDMYLGVFHSSFKLSPSTPLGIWKIRVVVDKMFQWEASKSFSVQKYVLPEFAAYITTNERHYLTNSIIIINFNARYSFGDQVIGNAHLIIRGISDNHEYLSAQFTNIKDIYTVRYKVTDDLKIATSGRVKLEVKIKFTEPESQITAEKSVNVTIHGNKKDRIEVNIAEKYMPGLPFSVKAFPYDWKDELILKNIEKVTFVYRFKHKNGNNGIVSNSEEIMNGIASNNFIVPETVKEFEVEVTFKSAVFQKKIEVGEVNIGVNKITVDHLPKNPKINDQVQIFVRSDSELDQIIGVVMTRYGNLEHHQIPCYYHLTCSFNITVQKDMMPQSTVIVYYVKNKIYLYEGSTNITTVDLGANHLSVDLPKDAKAKGKVSMTFKTKKYSSVYLLAFDKRLTYLYSGNDITNEDVIKDVADYDGHNEITVFKMDTWHECTREELERITEGRKLTTDHGGDYFTAESDNDIDEDVGELIGYQSEEPELDETPEADDMREHFPETWINEDFEMEDSNSLVRIYNAPDSITSWVVCAFSINEKHGLAIAPRQEIIVKNEFFMKLSLPYSIRYKEILRLDILVYNFAENKKELTANVDLHNANGGKEFQFVEYSGSNCIPSFSNALKMSKKVIVPYNNVRRVSFFVRPFTTNKEFEKRMFVIAEAKVEGSSMRDIIKKWLMVEPIGIKVYEVHNNNYQLKNDKDIVDTFSTKSASPLANYTEEFPKIHIAIAGDYIANTIDMNSRFEFYPSDCLEQKTSKMKGNVEYFRYMLTRNKKPSTARFSDYYQNLLMQRTSHWNYRNTAGYRAYFVEAVASAMEIGALTKNFNLINKELSAIKDFQKDSGDFKDFGNVPESNGNAESKVYFQTAYVLIPFIKFKNFMNTSYDDVINKGISFLDGSGNKLKTNREGLSVAAYVYALYGKFPEAKKLMDDVEAYGIKISKTQRCLKLDHTQKSCSMRHTSYAAIAYLQMNNTNKAVPLINWLLESNNLNKYYSNTHSYAIATEAIAKMAGRVTEKNTNFNVVIENEQKVVERVHITKANGGDPVEIDLPNYSMEAKTTIRGIGFCSITAIFEKIISISYTSTMFSVTTNVKEKSTVEICATYHTSDESVQMQTLLNVIYDVELPSGYVYKEIDKLEEKRSEIKLVVTKERGSRVLLYYNDFERGKKYCADIKATKVGDVIEMQNAGVKVYDYENKENVAVEFYKFSSSGCSI